jgi:hypothetical protein
MIRFFDGSLSQEWFIAELATSLASFCDSSSGADFVTVIHKRIRVPLPEWTSDLLTVSHHLVNWENGCQVVRQVFPLWRPSDQLSFATQIFSDFTALKWPEPWFQSLIFMLVREFRDDIDVLRPLIAFD